MIDVTSGIAEAGRQGSRGIINLKIKNEKGDGHE
jgi:hypothetical protein